MAGKSIVLQTSQMVFKEGDPSNGMFLVRSGELEVYLEKDGKTIVLASVVAGGMIGEMALFDQNPRSASVRATTTSEVTHISNEDFSKLMKQIPKWFTSLMGTLSTRLRVTNDRLKAVENATANPADNSSSSTKELSEEKQGNSLQHVLKMLYIFNLIIHKDAVKEGKHWQLERPTLSKNIELFFTDQMREFNNIISILEEHNFLQLTTNSYKVDIIDIANKGILNLLIEYISDFHKAGGAALSSDGILLLKCLVSYSKKAGYETFTASLQELALEAKSMGVEDTPDWKSQLPIFKIIHPELKLTKTSDGKLGIKSTPKAIAELMSYHTIMTKTLEDPEPKNNS
ncbi:MAG: cyclic nucleotide-binding domain-containing protein [Oligoflexales bacterium]